MDCAEFVQMAHFRDYGPLGSFCGHEEVPAGLFAPVTGRDEGSRPVTGRLSSEDPGLSGILLPLLIGSLPGLPAVLLVLLGTSLTPGLVRLGHAVAVPAEV